MNALTDSDFVSSFVCQKLVSKGVLQAPVSLRRLSQAAEVSDSKLVFLSEGRRAFVVMVSPDLFPEVVADECLKAAQMRSHLGDLGAPILEPLDAGRIQTSSYVVVPYCKPLSMRRGVHWLDRTWMRRPLLEWLLRVAHRHNGPCAPSRYQASLQALGTAVAKDSPTAALVRAAEQHLASGRFVPRVVPMHGDLWEGNVLHGVGDRVFTLVDWRGSATDGFPLFDLIRAASSFRLSAKSLQRELQRHRDALGCQVEDLPLYLLGALGHYAARLGEMPLARFRDMADDCVRHLSSALGPSARSPPMRPLADDYGQPAASRESLT
jgi:hypothetical protein